MQYLTFYCLFHKMPLIPLSTSFYLPNFINHPPTLRSHFNEVSFFFLCWSKSTSVLERLLLLFWAVVFKSVQITYLCFRRRFCRLSSFFLDIRRRRDEEIRVDKAYFIWGVSWKSKHKRRKESKTKKPLLRKNNEYPIDRWMRMVRRASSSFEFFTSLKWRWRLQNSDSIITIKASCKK